MQGETNESVGNLFSDDLLNEARNKTLQVIMQAAQRITAGMSENEAKIMIQQIQSELGAPKSWHPPQIRFGSNTTLPFGKTGVNNPILQKNDIFFFDIGPLFFDHEGDVGRSFTIGNDQEMQNCARDVGIIWNEVRQRWLTTGDSGLELYDFAKKMAEQKGWLLSLEKANGHRVSDFPHIARMRGSIEGFPQKPQSNRWILEIQIRHPHRDFGAFYEDLLV